jgi:pyrimidine operon attenuation protein/uracil phosphoribosyltransferase
MSSKATEVLNKQKINQKLIRMAWEILENNHNESKLIFAGIHPQGSIISKRLGQNIENISSVEVEFLEIKLDKKNPLNQPIEIGEHSELKDKTIVLVDDVLNSGKTLIYGAQYFLKERIKKLTTAVLIDRNYKRFPIKADVVGLSLSTTLQEHVEVKLGEKEGVYLT